MQRFLQVFLLATFTFISVTSNADNSQGYAWLAGQQQVDGSVSHEPNLTRSWQSTVETVMAFDVSNGSIGLNRAQALTYIASNNELSAEFIARALLLDIQVDNAGEPLISRLKIYQNVDGGFGAYEGFDSNVLDTALALSAMAKASDVDSDTISEALTFLLGKQSSDGGFVLVPNEVSSRPLTALVSISLQKYIIESESAINMVVLANEFLLENLSFEPGLENNWQTALSLLAITPLVRDSARYVNFVDLLTTTQAEDGSWYRDVFATAITLRALNLAANITFPLDITTGMVSGQIFDSNTEIPLAGVFVSLEEDTNQTIITNSSGRFTLVGVDPGLYKINYQLSGYLETSNSVEVEVLQTKNVGRINLVRLPDVVIIEGIVTAFSAEQSLLGVSITFTSDEALINVTTEGKGDFRIVANPGTYSYEVSLDGYQIVAGTVTFNAGNNILFMPELVPVNVSLGPTISLSGLLVDVADNNYVANAEVRVVGTTALSVTDSLGEFSLDALEEEKILLAVSAPGYNSRHIQVIATKGGSIDVGIIVLTKADYGGFSTSSVFGVIVDSETGLPITNADITVDATGISTKSSENGNYSLVGIEKKNFTLMVSALGYWSQLQAFSLSEAGNIQFDAALIQSDLDGFSIDNFTTNRSQYGAYESVSITAHLTNPSDISKSVNLLLEIFNADNVLISKLLVGSLTGGSGSIEAVSVSPDQSVPVGVQWYTGVTPPGAYSVKLSAFDKYTNQLLSEDVSYINISETINVAELVLRTNTEFSQVNATEKIVLMLDLINRSNVPISFTLETAWLKPNGVLLRTSEMDINLSTEEADETIVIEEYVYSFDVDGLYSITGQLANSDINDAQIQNATVSVAPSVRVEVSQELSIDNVVPDGDKRITVRIQLKGAAE